MDKPREPKYILMEELSTKKVFFYDTEKEFELDLEEACEIMNYLHRKIEQMKMNVTTDIIKGYLSELA